jgi:hypothetical protein
MIALAHGENKATINLFPVTVICQTKKTSIVKRYIINKNASEKIREEFKSTRMHQSNNTYQLEKVCLRVLAVLQ